MRFATLAGLFLLLLLAGVAAAPQAVPDTLRYSAEFTPAFSPRYWQPWSNCTGGYADNGSGGGCLAWDNVSRWVCGKPYTHLFSVQNPTLSSLLKSALGFTANFSFGGLFALLDAGSKALQSQGAFNNAYCYKGGNATAADIANFTGELAAINLTIQKGNGKGSWVPVEYGNSFNFEGQTEKTRTGREWGGKLGNDSVVVTVDSTTDWNCATCNFSNVTESGGSIALSTGNSSVAFQLDANTVSQWDLNGHSGDSNNTSANTLGITGGGPSYAWNASGNFSSAWDKTAEDRTRLRIADLTGEVSGSGLTLEFWYYLTTNAAGAGAYLVVKEAAAGSPGHGIYRGTGGGGPLFFDLNGGGGRCGGFTFPAAEQWHHYAMSYDGDTLYCFIDGQMVGEDKNPSGNPTNYGGVFSVGAEESSDTFNAAGLFDSIRWSSTARYTANFTPPTASITAVGNWTSQVFDSGTTETRWLNWTNASSSLETGTGIAWWYRTSNTSFANYSAVPAWTPLGNGTSDGTPNFLSGLAANRSRYAQFNATLYGSGGNSPSLDSFTVNFSRMPLNNGSFSGNVTYARPASPGVRQWVSLGIPYRDPDGDVGTDVAAVRLGVSNESGGADFCANATFAVRNATQGVNCTFVWNSTTDGERPAFVGNLTDSDGAWNLTNSSRSVVTDNAAPLTGVDAIANTSTGSFTLNVGAVDNSSGVNRSWYSVYNLSNSTDGSAAIPGLSNATWAANGTVSLCSTCVGQIRVSAQADDNLAQAVRFNSSLANASFWNDPVPVVSNVSLIAGATPSQIGRIRANVSETPDVTRVREVYLWVSRTGGPSTNYTMNLEAGDREEGVWTTTFVLSAELGDVDGTYNFQVRARDESTTDYGTGANATKIYGETGGGGGPGTGGGGGGGGPAPISAYATPTPPPAAAAALSPGTGLACPVDLRQAHVILPFDRETSRWSFTCRTLSGFVADSCEATGERVGNKGALSGVRDPRWGCEVVGQDSVKLTYTISLAQLNDSTYALLPTKEVSWDTLARVRVTSGGNATSMDARLHVTNLAAPLAIPLPPAVQGIVNLLAPLSVASAAVAGLVAALAWRSGGPLAPLAYAGAALLFLAGLGSPQGGVLGVWAEFGVVSALAWGWVKTSTTARIRRIQRSLSP